MPDYTYSPQELIVVRVEGVLGPEGTGLSRWNNVHHFVRDNDDPMDQAEPQDIYDQLVGLATQVSAVYEEVSVYLSNEWARHLVRAQVLEPFKSVFTDYVNILAGEVVEAVDEPDDAMVVAKRTFKAGRSFQGRFFLPGIPDSQVEGGAIDPAYIPQLIDPFASIISSGITVEGTIYRWVVFSPKTFETTPTVDACTAIIQSIDADKVMRRQTRRDTPFRVSVGPTPP